MLQIIILQAIRLQIIILQAIRLQIIQHNKMILFNL